MSTAEIAQLLKEYLEEGGGGIPEFDEIDIHGSVITIHFETYGDITLTVSQGGM